ncbi:hypothetical protein BD560DRAFT_414697 [Blakeslea trispora]|nr:hypothetical protein BD560DRAFT_414697 [Blakeslea trispora]
MADTRELPNPLELIHPLEPKRTLPTLASITQHPYPTHFELAPIRPIPLRKRRKRASVELQSMFLCEHPIGRDICGQTFRRSYDLSRHQTIHLKNRPFCYCHQCGKKFTRMDALRRHERVQSHSSSKHRSMSTSALPSSS